MNILISGWNALIDYLTISRIISLTIAFFLSGAIAQFMSKGAVMKYFGPSAKKYISYLTASVSGVILAVCSCSVLPMFASIRKKGAGIGPAVTFLFAGPAVNVLAITLTFSLIGTDIGIVRVIGATSVSIIIGLIMSKLYRKTEEVDPDQDLFELDDSSNRAWWQDALFFVLLLGMLLLGVKNPLPTSILAALLGIVLYQYFSKEELIEWCNETWNLAKKIVPLFIVGVFAAGMITAIIPRSYMVKFVGANTISANLIAGVSGALMYFATLTEVPIVKSFMDLGMIKGPVISLLLAGPSLSLPNMMVISKVMGLKKTSTYILLVVILSATIGLFAGTLIV